jgi:diacylglycerol kinase (ATP)
MLDRAIRAFYHSIAGLRACYATEPAFRQELIFALFAIPFALFVDVGAVGKAAMVASVLLVLIVELLNSAIEATVDRISQEKSPLAKKAKDMGSAAVLVALVNLICVWGIVLFL